MGGDKRPGTECRTAKYLSPLGIFKFYFASVIPLLVTKTNIHCH